MHQTRIQSLRQLTPTILEISVPRPFDFEAGQYAEVAFPALADEEPRFFPLALASGPTRELLQFCIRQAPENSMFPYLQALTDGAALQLRGPLGSFGYASGPGRGVAMLATGTGIAPMRSILQSQAFLAHSPQTTLLFGAYNQDELPYLDEWDALPFLEALPVLEAPHPGWDGLTGWITDHLSGDLLAWTETDFYLCGHPQMLSTAEALLQKQGVLPSAIFKA